MIVLSLLTGSVAQSFSQNCPTVNTTNTISGYYVTVNNGETYGLSSGSWSGGVTLNAGGTIYIAPGASLTVSYVNGDFNGKIINCGTLNINLYNNPRNAEIINYGTLTSNAIQNLTGSITNYGKLSIAQFTTNGATLMNYKKMNLQNVSLQNTVVNNHDTLEVNGGFYALNGGTIDNRVNAYMSLNGAYGNTELATTVENAGTMIMRTANSGSGISRKVNNYGVMRIYDQVTITSNAYFTNDSLLEFVNINTVNMQGNALLQNNKSLNVISGNIALNSANGQFVNNGMVKVSGSVSQNAAGSKVINNCRIFAGSYFIGNGVTENKGLIWVTGEFKVEGLPSEVKNDTTGFIRGTNFRNSGKITGYGSFYFTGNTDFNSAGVFAGSSASSPIMFFDASQTGNQIFDTYVQNNPAINTIRPTAMVPMDTTGYNCTPTLAIAGFPPTTALVYKQVCANAPILINLNDYVAPHTTVNAQPFTVQLNSTKLFDYYNKGNVTNNTSSLDIPNKGTFIVNEATGIITFTPSANFSQGEVKAQYIISNTAAGNPMTYPSNKTNITITIGSGYSAPIISVNQQ
ncbi:MAG: hypothetical protein EOP54_15525 [Sphingobacteriales bacterium]|nr:MAG: hypothetical protein EOP54_15525 [Sphingobacteriales bacterium]